MEKLSQRTRALWEKLRSVAFYIVCSFCALVAMVSAAIVLCVVLIDKATLIKPLNLHQLLDVAHATTSINTEHLTHDYTGVSTLHRLGIVGTGATIAIIDDGIDYLHPAFGGRLGSNYTLSYGFSFGSQDDGTQDIYPGPDPSTECASHGTHLAGIAAGHHEELGFVGVAPHAKLEVYRVTGCEHRARMSTRAVVDAIELARSRRVDVISLSFTMGTGPYIDGAVAELLEQIVKEDRIVCVVSAGNHGWMGPFSSSSPVASPGILSVGATNARGIVRSYPRAQYVIDGDSSTYDFAWRPAPPSRYPPTMPLRSLADKNGIAGDACEPLDEALSFESAVILVRRGGCPFAEKMKHLTDRGASYALIYNNNTAEKYPFDFENAFPGIKGVGSVSADVGSALAAILAKGTSIEVLMDSNFTLRPILQAVPQSVDPGGIRVRGSWGPSGVLDITPSLLAPGSDILSSVPRSHGGYQNYSGTSMAAPYIAGCVALLRQAYPSAQASELIQRLTTTSSPLHFSDGTSRSYNYLAPAWQQGSGSLNAFAAYTSQSEITPSRLPFNDTVNSRKTLTFRVRNRGHESAEYRLAHREASTIALFVSSRNQTVVRWTSDNMGSEASSEFLDMILPISVNLTIRPSGFSLAPNESQVVEVDVDTTPLRGYQDRCPLYSGYIQVATTRGENLTIPYGGIGCSMQSIPVIPREWKGILLTAATLEQTDSIHFDGDPIAEDYLFAIPRRRFAELETNSDVQYPTIKMELAMPSPRVEAFVTIVASHLNEEEEWVPIITYPREEGRSASYSRVDIDFQLWTGELLNGSWAISHSYRFQVCATRAWGSRKDCIATRKFFLQYLD